VRNSYGYDAPTATLNRQVSATVARENLTKQEAIAIHTHMSQTPETKLCNNQYPDLKDSADTYDRIKWFPSIKYFSEYKDHVILKEWPLTNKIALSLKIDRAIIGKHNLVRTAKQVQGH